MEQRDISFAAIEGHERPIKILKRALANRTLAHAYLFSGDPGLGKNMTAFALAAAVQCPAAGEEGGCGTCPACRKVAVSGHPDVRFLVPDGAEIKIDQIRQVQADLALKPFEGSKKVLLVDGAESMNQASSNAFLKTLEEPPGDALIILITARPQSLLATIRSRCQEIRFLPLPRHILAESLMRRRGLSEEDAWFLAALSQGSMGRGLEMEVEREKADREELMARWSELERMGPMEMLAQADALSKDREQLDRFLDLGVERLRDALVFQETGNEKLLVYGHGKEALRQWGERYPAQRLLANVELFVESRRLLERRTSGQLVAENLLLKLGQA
jgi:DNA polymerase-3 subunit delta'